MATEAKTSVHRDLISDYDDAITAIREDIYNGIGIIPSIEEAKQMYVSVRDFSDVDFKRIRSAYNNPNAFSYHKKRMDAIDCYIQGSPKWQGEIYRGIDVSKSVANTILSQNSVDMLGPSSWSSDLCVAQKFALGSNDVHIVFVLPQNKSGVSITHISCFNGTEKEIMAPSGIKYYIDQREKRTIDGREYIFVYVHE